MACYEALRDWDFGLVDGVMTEVGRDEASVTNRVTKSFNRMLGSNLHLLTMYGPEFLDDAELAIRVEQHLVNYYGYLGRSRFERREPAFWDFHRDMLAQCGVRLDPARLRQATFAALRTHPRWMLRNLVYSFLPEKSA